MVKALILDLRNVVVSEFSLCQLDRLPKGLFFLLQLTNET